MSTPPVHIASPTRMPEQTTANQVYVTGLLPSIANNTVGQVNDSVFEDGYKYLCKYTIGREKSYI
jgi:hypothetical protein